MGNQLQQSILYHLLKYSYISLYSFPLCIIISLPVNHWPSSVAGLCNGVSKWSFLKGIKSDDDDEIKRGNMTSRRQKAL